MSPEMQYQKILEAFGSDLNKVIKLRESILAVNRKPVALVLPRLTLFGMKLEFGDVDKPSIRFQKD